MTTQGPSILNLENKIRQQPKIAHEQGAGSQCMKCGPKCKGFDLHYWRKICRNCRCGKENHMVQDDQDPGNLRVGRLFDEDISETTRCTSHPKQNNNNGIEYSKKGLLYSEPSTTSSNLAVHYTERHGASVQPIADKEAAANRKRAFDRQLPVHDLDPSCCQSLSEKEKQKMEDYVNNVKQFVVGRGLMQQCPTNYVPPVPSASKVDYKMTKPNVGLPPPPPQLDRILEQKVHHLNLDGKVSASRSPNSVPRSLNNIVPKPFKPVDFSIQRSSHGGATELIGKQPTVASKSIVHDEYDQDLPPPPPELLESFSEPFVCRKSQDPVTELLDFIGEQEKKKPMRKAESPLMSRSNFNATPKPFEMSSQSVLNKPLRTQGIAWHETEAVRHFEEPQGLLTTDFDDIPLEPPKQFRTPQEQDPSVWKSGAREIDQDDLSVCGAQHPFHVETGEPFYPDQSSFNVGLQSGDNMQKEIIEIEKIWLCQNCMNPVRGGEVAIFAERAGSDKCWHPQCFVCSICNETLADLIYFYVEDQIFCGRHYAERMNIPRCKACDELIFAHEYTNAEGANWHTDHFCCWLCDTPLAGHQYTPIDGQPHCLDCYQKKYGKDCHLCRLPIRADESRVSHGEMHWHASDKCFRCHTCHISMLNKQFLLKGDHIFCSRNCSQEAMKSSR